MAGDDFRELMNAMADPLVACDGDECVLYLNPAAERLLGWTLKELRGEPFARLVPERLRTFDGHSFLRYLLGRRRALSGRPVRVFLLRHEGSELEVEVTVGTAMGGGGERIAVVLRRPPELPDYTDEPLERVSSAVHAHAPHPPGSAGERAYQLVFENAPLGLFHFDTAPTIVACNDYFVRIMGSSKRLLIGLNLLTLQDEAILACVRDVLAGRHAYYEGEYRSVTADKLTPVRAHFAPCFGEDGQVEGGVGIVEDVTEQRSAEAERNRLFREAQEAIRVRDDFLTIASHELKTPLTPLSLRLASLERRMERKEPVDPTLLRHARQHLVRLAALINDLLDASRIEAGRLALHFEPMRLDAIVERALTTMDAERGQHRIDYSHPEEGVRIRGDPYRLEQVIANLLENALKYSPADSTVRVTLDVRGDFALLSVSDEGIGIPRDQQEQLFERYFRARNVSITSYGGLGLGLYISRDIVERHGGRIWVESEVGRGATFYVALPLLSAANPTPPEPRPATDSTHQVH
ncbi:PAS domain S-box-containing protein [Archangium gephyra]|uniref:histidine kinase n=1 Tax=Archangium gephyra TaxID=48 RepID=A0AAC8Q2Y7_9BACT|nr:ATP-binding protein [Archangium gephyra]AKI99983.1 sensory box histidine kinase [Archangium gephyra]REG33308.1 PAS domain S-box-containing protein [Archangium gephyra]